MSLSILCHLISEELIHKYWSLSLRFSMNVSEYITHGFKITSENNERHT